MLVLVLLLLLLLLPRASFCCGRQLLRLLTPASPLCSGAGFAIIGTVLDAPHTGNVWSFGGFCPWLPLPSGGNGLNSLGLPSKGCAKALENIQKFKDNHTEEELAGFPIGLSIMGHPAKQGAAKLEGVLQCVRDAVHQHPCCEFLEFP